MNYQLITAAFFVFIESVISLVKLIQTFGSFYNSIQVRKMVDVDQIDRWCLCLRWDRLAVCLGFWFFT